MNEAIKELTLADFQQQVAEKYGYKEWEGPETVVQMTGKSMLELYDEAWEAYAQYRFEQGKQEGEANANGWTKAELRNMLEDVVNELNISGEMIEKHGPLGTPPAELVRLVLAEKDMKIQMLKTWHESILNGLKQEEEGEAVSERSKLLNCKFCKSEHVYRYTCGNMVGFAKCKDCKKEFEI